MSLVANWKQKGRLKLFKIQTFGAHLVSCNLQMLGNKQIKAYDK